VAFSLVWRDPSRPASVPVRGLAVLAWLLVIASFVGAALTGERAAIELQRLEDRIEVQVEIQTLHAEGQADVALKRTRAVAQASSRGTWLGQLGIALGHGGCDREARVLFVRWLDLEPEDPAALNALAWHLVTTRHFRARDPKRALELSQASLRLIKAPSSQTGRLQRAAYLDTLAETLFQLGRLDEALRYQREAVALLEELRGPPGLAERLRQRFAEPGSGDPNDVHARLRKIEQAVREAKKAKQGR